MTAQNGGMEPDTEPDFIPVQEFLERTGGVPVAPTAEEVAARRQQFLDALDPDDSPF